MIPTVLALPLALMPIFALVAALIWMANSSGSPATRA